MIFTLSASMFENGSYTVEYGYKKATFTIIDEDYTGSNGLFLAVNRMLCTVKTYDETGSLLDETFGSLVIGMGDENVAITTNEPSIRGKLLTKDNMEQCVVELYED